MNKMCKILLESTEIQDFPFSKHWHANGTGPGILFCSSQEHRKGALQRSTNLQLFSLICRLTHLSDTSWIRRQISLVCVEVTEGRIFSLGSCMYLFLGWILLQFPWPFPLDHHWWISSWAQAQGSHHLHLSVLTSICQKLVSLANSCLSHTPLVLDWNQLGTWWNIKLTVLISEWSSPLIPKQIQEAPGCCS